MTGMVASSLILHKPSSELWPALLRVLSLPVGWEVASLHGRETSSLPHGPSWSGVPSSSSLILFLSCVVQARKMFLEKISDCVICPLHFGLSFGSSSISWPQRTEAQRDKAFFSAVL